MTSNSYASDEPLILGASADRAVRPERLLKRARLRSRGSRLKGAAARKALRPLLNSLEGGLLRVTDIDGSTTEYGSLGNYGDDGLRGHITVSDERAWSAVALEGAVGLGRGYIENWWDSPEPTDVIKLLARNLPRLDRFRNMWASTGGRVADTVRLVLPRRSRSRNKEDIAAHYDLGNEFFKLFLDETLTYSSGVFPSADATLRQASIHKYDRLLHKVRAEKGDKVLEIGTGWGGFALHAAEAFGCHVKTTTVSAEQYKEANKRIAETGLSDRIEVIESDWRDLEGQFDRVCSIEMIEAVDWRDYKDYFATIQRCLKPDGLVGIQAICAADQRWERFKNTKDFIRHFVFPGGMLPSLGSINSAVSDATDLQILDLEDISAHYSETLRQWREQFDERLVDIQELGLDSRFCRLWRFYLSYCEAAFSERYITVVQLVLAGPKWRPDGLEVRPL